MRQCVCVLFFFNDTATTEIYTLSLHDALPISEMCRNPSVSASAFTTSMCGIGLCVAVPAGVGTSASSARRSEEHTSELQSRQYLVCRLLLEKKKHNQHIDLVLPLKHSKPISFH